MREKWILQTKKADFEAIGQKFHISPVLARIMVNRNVKEEEEIKKYLYGELKDLHNPHLMKDLDGAVKRISEEAAKKKIIAIATDYDNDGLLSAYTLKKSIETIGGRAEVFAPDRVTEGYGLNRRIVEDAYHTGAELLVTCDNGIAAISAIAYAKEKGMDVIVTDHHEVQFEEQEDGSRKFILPDADYIVNPKQADCEYPFKGLCGAGVVFKMIQVLYEQYNIPQAQLENLLQYTAIATVADVMDLTDENRIIVKKGLSLLKNTDNLGLEALIEANQLDKNRISAYHIGFVIGPCFNAAGRLETVKKAFDLLESKTKEEAAQRAASLKALNDSRKDMTLKGVEQAVELIEHTELIHDKVLLVKLEDTHESLAGIIAGRIREIYHKPIIVFTDTEDGIKGSGRSIESYNMFEELLKCKALLSKFGGHPMAAGLSLPLENLEPLRKQLNENATLTEEDFIPVIKIDVPMPIGYISEKFVEELEYLEPFGKANPKPVFAEQHFSIIAGNIIGKNKNVWKGRIRNQAGDVIEAIYFGDIDQFMDFMKEEYGAAEVEQMMQGRKNNIDIAFTYYPSINEFRGEVTLQIVIQNYCRIK